MSTTVVSRRRNRRATMSSSTANASVDATRSCSESPTTARKASLDTIWLAANVSAAQVLFPDAIGTDEHHQARRRQRPHTSVALTRASRSGHDEAKPGCNGYSATSATGTQRRSSVSALLAATSTSITVWTITVA